MECGADAADINRVMFDTKSRARLEMERSVMDSMEFFYDYRCAVIHISQEMVERTGAKESDMEAVSYTHLGRSILRLFWERRLALG